MEELDIHFRLLEIISILLPLTAILLGFVPRLLNELPAWADRRVVYGVGRMAVIALGCLVTAGAISIGVAILAVPIGFLLLQLILLYTALIALGGATVLVISSIDPRFAAGRQQYLSEWGSNESDTEDESK